MKPSGLTRKQIDFLKFVLTINDLRVIEIKVVSIVLKQGWYYPEAVADVLNNLRDRFQTMYIKDRKSSREGTAYKEIMK